VQDRGRQKRWLTEHGFPVGPYREVSTEEQLRAAAQEADGQAFAKLCTGGYDGRAQFRLTNMSQVGDAWRSLGGGACVVERALDLEMEISVLVARRPGGESTVYAPSCNQHEQGVLDWAVIPAPVSDEVAQHATEIALGIAEKLDVVGLLVTEVFVLRDGTVAVNELAPRPHNSFHHTELTVRTSQFEQAVRAVCDLPLGATDVVRPAAIANLFGDLWLEEVPPAWQRALELPGVRIHLYGKSPRPGRKMGHVGAVGASAGEAAELAREARRRLHGSEH
jgi:5-(carboxyamino)imidazole ribonucleotide synthase